MISNDVIVNRGDESGALGRVATPAPAGNSSNNGITDKIIDDNEEATITANAEAENVIEQTILSPATQETTTTTTTTTAGATTPKPASSPILNPSSTMHQMEHFLRIKNIVKNAIAARHTFMIYGRSRIIRECLLNRGWCEKLHKKGPGGQSASEQQQLSIDSNPTTLLSGIGNLNDRQNERLLISKMLSNHTVDFLWNAGSEWTGWPSQDNKTTIFNRFTRANFTSKVGLCSNVRQMHWFYEAGIANTLFPRCYNISQPDQMHAFIDDFRLTACLSLLKWLVDKIKSGGEESVRASNGIIPLRALDFAIGRCSDFIGSKSHEDIDQELEKVWSHQWEQFISWYYKLVHGHAVFIANNVPIHKYLLAARHLLKKVKKYWPQLEMDGIMNIWILKPGNKSRGRGIVLMNKLDDILAKVNPTNKTTDMRFVIQKYIERPLLIYDTKFDIRQWFIVTSAQPLTLWMYRESYLRFCSQKFSLTDYHESIHLSNNAVQCKYKNSPDRDSSLPNDNMWDVPTFKEYLKCRGNGDAWDELIYPGMKQGLVGSLLASQEAMDRRKNSFELYGADFMVMEDFSVWLIEINSHPDMSNSTSVTTRLCRKAMEDTIKVVVDYRENPNAETGDFELVYKQKLSSCQAYMGTGLSLHGTRIALGEKRSSPTLASTNPISKRKSSLAPTQESIHVGPVLVDLIEELELQLDHEFYEYLKLRSSSGLTRQILPLPSASATPVHKSSADGNQAFDCETNTVTRNVNLLLSTSQTTLKTAATSPSAIAAQRNISSKILRNNSKNSPSKKSVKHKTNAALKTSESTTVTPQAAKALISKIINLQKQTVKSNKSAPNTTAKSYRSARTSETFVLNNNESPQVNEVTSTKEEKKDEKKDDKEVVNSKVVPEMPEELVISASKDKIVKTSGSTADGMKHFRIKKRNRANLNSHVYVDVTDMYAVGLAVNK